MNMDKVYRFSESGSEERGGVSSRAHLHLKRHATIWLAVNRADFDTMKTVLFYTNIEKF